MMPDGTGYNKLHDFGNALDGSNPYGSLLIEGSYLYGMTVAGGTNNLGTVFKIMIDGTGYSKLFDLGSNVSGYFPDGSLISDGTFLYGLTQNGGTINKGVMFKIKPDGTGYANLLNFDSVAHGRNPHGSLIYDGTLLYGMTYQGGTNDNGTIFKYCISPPLTFSQSPTICFKNSLTIGSHSYTLAGNYTDTVSSYWGCDSIISTSLSIDSVNTSVTQALPMLTANASPATYQWINCGSGNTPITGQTSQNFTPTSNGSYAVIVSQNGCSDTSICYTITTTSNSDFYKDESNSITIFPNPFSSQTTVEINGRWKMENGKCELRMVDLLGQEVYRSEIKTSKILINRGELREGIYFLQLKIVQGTVTKKLIVE